MSENLSKSLEDYLEAIYVISLTQKVVRVKHISNFLKVKNPSALRAIKTLEKNGFLQHERYGFIELTEKGLKYAKAIYEKHILIKDFFEKVLMIPSDIAEHDACLLEHYLSEMTLDRMSKFLYFRKTCPKGTEPSEEFEYFLKHGKRK